MLKAGTSIISGNIVRLLWVRNKARRNGLKYKCFKGMAEMKVKIVGMR